MLEILGFCFATEGSSIVTIIILGMLIAGINDLVSNIKRK